MRRLSVLLIFLAIRNPAQAQSSFSFNCVKDTLIDCITPCITLHTTLPDVFSSTTSYTVNPTCFKPYISPAAPGTSANLTIDDRYSPLIDITFPFSFYGNTYTKLAASTNGFLTFDNSKATTFSHYGILANGTLLSSTTGTPQDLPSSLYDGAIIMGPYHDLDPNNATSSLQMKYDIVGTAPYRKWILSYYNVPLYTTACLNLATNTHQIVLYETLGFVEVFIYDKEICLNWNNGRSMIGLQDISKTSAIMAPARRATSAPWGSQSMNESWRFVPASGSSLFDRAELYTLSGAFVAKGITSALPNNLLDVNFSNVCPPPAGDVYVVKSYYKNPDGSANQIIGTDTINVSRGQPIAATLTAAGCASSTTGSISISSPIGSTYEYSIDGINWQSSNVFTMPAGTYTARARETGSNCVSTKSFTIKNSPITASLTTTSTRCSGSPTGSITLQPENGTAPYIFSIDGINFQISNVFTNLDAGNYTVTIKDASGCSYSRLVIIGKEGPSFTTTIVKPICGGSTTGSITVNATGNAPFTYAINTNPPQSSNVFNNITTGTHTVFVYDNAGCTSANSVTVTSDIIINANPSMKMPTCYGGSDGAITINPSLGTAPYQFALDTSAYQNINAFNNLDSGNYLLHVKDSKGCIKDTLVTVLEPNIFRITAITTRATSCASLDGQITIKANGGTTPYLYSVDNGGTFTVNNTFTVRSGNFPLAVKDNKGCLTTGSATVDAVNNDMTLELGPDKTVCSGDSLTLSPVINLTADYFRWTPPLGVSDTTSAQPKVDPADTTKYYLTARVGYCERNDSITINVLRKPNVTAGTDTSICYNTQGILNGSATNLSGTVTYLWTPAADVTNPNSAITLVRPRVSGPNIYRLQVTDSYGCNFKVYDQVVVFVYAPVPAFAGNDTVASIGVPHQLFGSGGVNYTWWPSNVLDNPLSQTPMATLQNDTRFNLVVKDALGCTGTSTVMVKVYKGTTYYIPNAFTPNGDGLNDEFKAVAPGIQQTNYFRVFDRWGHLMFETKDVRKGWDGRYAGVGQPTAVYVWVIKGVDVSGKVVEFRGTVTLIR
jgi:gliding motility-associated-like protein